MLNATQKVVLAFGVTLILGAVLFPCWEWREGTDDFSDHHAQIRFIATPPAATQRWLDFGLMAALTLPVAVIMGSLLILGSDRMSESRRIKLREGNESPTQAGRLIDALEYGSRYVRPHTRTALAELLPKLNPSQVMLLTSASRVQLTAELRRCRSRRDAAFLVAALRVLAHIGNRETIRAVNRAARSSSPHEHGGAVRSAARDCVAAIEARIAARATAGVLLRPAAASPEADILLRAPAPTREDEGQLVRAVGDDRVA